MAMALPPRTTHPKEEFMRSHSDLLSPITVITSAQQGQWTLAHTTLQDFIVNPPTSNVVLAFLPGEAVISSETIKDSLSLDFGIPHYFWKKVALESTGFFGGLESDNGSYQTIFRFLIKEAVRVPVTNPISRRDPRLSYLWHKLGFFTSWQANKWARYLCFDIPADLQGSIRTILMKTEQVSHLEDPYLMHSLLVAELTTEFDRSVWSWRDLVRDIEKNRTATNPPEPNYVKMHEVARHAVHSSETLAMALETLHSMIQEQEDYSGQLLSNSSKPTVLFRRTRKSLKLQVTILKCLQLRSKALEERLRNEMNLAFNLVTQYDSRIGVKIAEATKADSAAVKTIAILGLTFLPGTLVCAIFSMSFFNFTPGSGTQSARWTVSSKFWVYWAVTLPITALAIIIWFIWNRVSR